MEDTWNGSSLILLFQKCEGLLFQQRGKQVWNWWCWASSSSGLLVAKAGEQNCFSKIMQEEAGITASTI